MKNQTLSIKDRLVAKYLDTNTKNTNLKSTDINVLLNRVKTNQKKEIRKKLYFSVAASTGLLLFGIIIF